jgi:hypothetical protein
VTQAETPLEKRLRAVGEYLRRESGRGIDEAEGFLGQIAQQHTDYDREEEA